MTSLTGQGWSVVVVDDGSNIPVVSQNHAVTILRHRFNLGQGAALSTGMQFIRSMNPSIAIHMDADGQHDVADIEKLAKPVMENKADIAIGSRFLEQSSIDAIPPARRWLLRVARWCNTLFTGANMSDAHNGFRALGPKAIQNLNWHAAGREHASEIVWRIRQLGLRYTEVPVHIRYGKAEESKRVSLFTWIRLGLSLIFLRLQRYEKPNAKVIAEQQATLKQAGLVNIVHE